MALRRAQDPFGGVYTELVEVLRTPLVSVLVWGTRGREFESHHSDNKLKSLANNQLVKLFLYQIYSKLLML